MDIGIKTINCQSCGRSIDLVSLWVNRCKCGVEYNGLGQILASNPHRNSEEPGKRPTDISRLDQEDAGEGEEDDE